MGMAGTLALGGLLLHAAIDFPLQITSIQLCAVVMCGLFLGQPNERVVSFRKKSKRRIENWG
jgi:hypothetical protein